jgi:GDP-L-fucose synthase
LGGSGFVGKNFIKKLISYNYKNLLYPSSTDLDLLNPSKVNQYLKKEKPKYIFLIAASYGGIFSCKENIGKYLYDNSMIALNVIHSAHVNNIEKLIYVSSSTIYPKSCPQPMKEEYLLTGKLEENIEGYGLSKILGVKMCELYNKQYDDNFFSVIPTNMFGPYDRFYDKNSNVLAALITKIYEAKKNKSETVELFGTGTPKREFLYVEDFSEALIFLANNYNNSYRLNIGSGEEVSISELADKIKSIIGYRGKIIFNPNYPDGSKRKLLDSTRVNNLGWKAETKLEKGIEKTYKWFLENYH